MFGAIRLFTLALGATFYLPLGIFSAHAAGEPDHTLTTTGPEEIYLSRKDMNCGPTSRGSGRDTTDLPVTAFRRKDGSVLVLAGNKNNYHLEGPSIEKAKRTSCSNLVPPAPDPDPAKFVAHRWLFAVGAKTHDLVFGFVHNEYHGNDVHREGCGRTTRRNFECWYGSTTLVVSYDGGFMFQTPADNVLASPPVKFEIGRKRVGANSPKIVGNPHDGMIYVMINYLDRNRDLGGHQCLLRGSGRRFDDWRAWDGQGFNLNMKSPYAVERGPDCAPVLDFVVTSVKYVPAIRKFIAVGLRGTEAVYVFSTDLLKWSDAKPIMQVTRIQTWHPGGPAVRAYFSLLDDTSSSINFDTIEQNPYLYFVQFDTQDKRKVDVYRVPVAIK